MKRIMFVLIVVIVCVAKVSGCSDDESSGVIQPSEIEAFLNSMNNNATPEGQKQVKLGIPRSSEWEIVGEIINNAGIDYVLDERDLYFDASENVVLTFEAFDENGIRLNYECRYPSELLRNSNGFMQIAYRKVEVNSWIITIDTPDRTINNEVRLMSWTPYNDSNGYIIGFSKFLRTAETPVFRPIVIPYDDLYGVNLVGVPGKDRYLNFGKDAEDFLWNEIPDQSRHSTRVLEVTVGENYLPDENGIRFVGVGEPGRTDSPMEVMIICDAPSLDITYDGKIETFIAFGGVIYAKIWPTHEERMGDTFIINGKEYPRIFFGKYQRNITVVIDELCNQPVFHENDVLREYTIVLAEIEK